MAVCDAFRYRLDEVAKAAGAKACTKYSDVLSNPEVDVVCIAISDHLHVLQAIDVLLEGYDFRPPLDKLLSKRRVEVSVQFSELRNGNMNRKELARRLHAEVLKLKQVRYSPARYSLRLDESQPTPFFSGRPLMPRK